MGERDFEEWMRFARDDLEAAQFLMGMSPRKLEVICFHCQQSAEKYLKALLARVDEPIPRTHVLLSLLDTVGTLFPATVSLAPALSRLEPYAVGVRYPFQVEIMSGLEEAALASAAAIATLIESLPAK